MSSDLLMPGTHNERSQQAHVFQLTMGDDHDIPISNTVSDNNLFAVSAPRGASDQIEPCGPQFVFDWQ